MIVSNISSIKIKINSPEAPFKLASDVFLLIRGSFEYQSSPYNCCLLCKCDASHMGLFPVVRKLYVTHWHIFQNYTKP